MKVRFDFNVEAWIRGVEVEGDDYDDAENNLYRMTLEELLEEGYVQSFEITDCDSAIIEQEYTVKCSNIKYDISPSDIMDLEEYKTLTDEEIDRRIDEVIQTLPTELTVEVYGNPRDDDGFEYEISDVLSDKTGWCILDFDYEIED
jgi:hypothetical protein